MQRKRPEPVRVTQVKQRSHRNAIRVPWEKVCSCAQKYEENLLKWSTSLEITLSAQPVDATPSKLLVRRCFPLGSSQYPHRLLTNLFYFNCRIRSCRNCRSGSCWVSARAFS